ncbi:hypothetical protein B0J15DRAFT_410886 [Fusarium solani]|uniref:Uncharacterized protein n=1 Tax=Fusarium solani TaxID=169388 RepID=A0A9P9G126_FUSSL|nr:uncharacterized protein B0J15DRAFT_410886 [Fusarium solani]KAH7230313.1 hypothetical protein B0J15DRAFT_410886 [Fusarium solani]
MHAQQLRLTRYTTTILHPAIRWGFLYYTYQQRPDWIKKAQRLISSLWRGYKQFPI